VPLAVVDSPLTIGALIAVVIALLLADLVFFARGREPSFGESVAWSIGWLLLGLAMALPMWAIDNGDGAINYLTVYLIERTLSLDNLFVFLLVFGAFAVPQEHRGKLLFWGIVLALVMRGLAILVGVELIERFHWIIYVLGATLLVLAWRILRGAHEQVDPGHGRTARAARRVLPVGEHFHGARFLAREDGRRVATPMVLALAGVVAADIAFAVDSIPAAFAITTDAFAIWAANAFALMGLRALFSLVEELIRRFRYLDQTIAVVLGMVGVKLLLEDVYAVGPVASLLIVLASFAVGITASILADHRDPEGAAERRAAA
jgi:TerC family integral membrane protein